MRVKGYLTVFLTLLLTVVIALYLTLYEIVRTRGSLLEAACAGEVATESVLAEYNRELLNRYNLFAIDSSYGTTAYGRKNVEQRLLEYLQQNCNAGEVFLYTYLYRDLLGMEAVDAQITGMQLLSDSSGEVFREMCMNAILSDVNLDILQTVYDWLRTVEVNQLTSNTFDANREELNRQLEQYNSNLEMQDEETEYENVENPAAVVDGKLKLGILQLAFDSEDTLSRKGINLSQLYSMRKARGEVSKGNMLTEDTESLMDRLLFNEYVMRYFSHFGQNTESEVLSYQVEYVLSGGTTDVDNLRSIANRLLVIRELANVVSLTSDESKMAEVRATAATLSGVLVIPELEPVLEGILIAGWASAESIYDVKTLLHSGKIELIKSGENWHYSLQQALSGEEARAGEEQKGLSYEDYLRILLAISNPETISARTMDIIESEVRMTEGNSNFRLDACVFRFDVTFTVKSQFGKVYTVQRSGRYE